jgi:hypothetical protein
MSVGGKNQTKNKWFFRNPKMLGIIVLRFPLQEMIIIAQRLAYNWKQGFSS